jgi:tetratricopeptide (TPR) repeat protein
VSEPATSKDACVGTILDEYLRALEDGTAPDRESLFARHPEVAAELAAALRGLDLVRGAVPSLAGANAADADVGRTLGEYKLLREIGRGGMAVVYEAEQVSLGRRVAVKVLPFAAVLDPKQLQRFKNEALAAAHLHHPHIVPVHAVGCDRGVHYYAMQFVEGQSLALVVREMKQGGGEGPKTPISSLGSNRVRDYVRMAATLGKQAAEALDHAHQLGIVHRDVKPGNLLVDQAGSLWVTDFGLARSLKDPGLTITGELLGTVRYMSPEQTLAKRVPIDHRTDVYSLGVTLYELFTLEPAYPGDDPHRVIHEIASREPVPPRRLNPALPVDLETVLLKAMSKDPASRYATAQEMADDLDRFLGDEPVRARRPSIAARAAKWARRHRGLATAAIGILLLGIAALAIDHVRVTHERNRAQANLALARDAVDKFLVEAGIGDFEERPLPPPARRALLETALAFYENNIDDDAALRTRGDILHALHDYAAALEIFDRALARDPRDGRSLVGRGHMLWHQRRRDEALAAFDRAVEVAPDLADACSWRAVVLYDQGEKERAIRELRAAAGTWPRDAAVHYSLGMLLLEQGDLDGAIAANGEALKIEPGYASAHCNLGTALLRRGDVDDAIREYRAAVQIEPDHPANRRDLGDALLQKGDRDGAVREYQEAVRLDPDDAHSNVQLGNLLAQRGECANAIHACREAIRVRPDYALAHYNLGCALTATGEIDAAIDAYLEAVRIDPDYADAHCNLANRLADKRDFAGAIQHYRDALDHRPGIAAAHNGLGLALEATGERELAIEQYRLAIECQRERPEAHANLAVALARSGRVDEAIEEFLTALRFAPELPEVHRNLARLLHGIGRHEEEIDHFEAVLRVRPDDAVTRCDLAKALAHAGRFQESFEEFRRAHELGSKRADWSLPSARWVDEAERSAELERRLDAVQSGADRPRDAVERTEFGRVLYSKRRHAEAAAQYAAALDEDPSLASGSHRYDAACCAVLAASNGGTDAAGWRARALGWLREELAAREPSTLVAKLEHWKRDSDFASVRERLPDLPEAERDAWSKLWADVDERLASARSHR